MKKKILFIVFLIFISNLFSQENEEKLPSQFSPFLSKTYYNFNFGLVHYPFSNKNLKPGYISENTESNAFSGRFLLGYKIRENLGLQFGVMRPASWFKYTNINGIQYDKSVWINLWSLSLKKSITLNNRLRAYGELGIGNLNRVGFSIGEDVIYSDAHYATLVSGLGLEYSLKKNWNLLINTTYLPTSKKHNQPYTFQSSLGLSYNVQPIPQKEALKRAQDSVYFFPKRTIQIGYGTSKIGFYPNEFLSMKATIGNFDSFGIPVFWLGDSEAGHTFSVTYQQTAFRSKKLFSLDWGLSITGFQTVATKTNVLAFSIYPIVRFYLLRRKAFDSYLSYSIIGPTFISKSNIDNLETGPKFTYQDFIEMGAFLGEKRKLNLALKIIHYSNGNIFSKNAGIAIPVTLSLGKTF